MHASMKSVRFTKNATSWISRPIRDEMDKQNTLLKRSNCNCRPSAWEAYRLQRDVATRLLRNAKREHFHNLVAKSHISPLHVKLSSLLRPLHWGQKTGMHTAPIIRMLQTLTIATLCMRLSPTVQILRHLVHLLLPVLATFQLHLPSLKLVKPGVKKLSLI